MTQTQLPIFEPEWCVLLYYLSSLWIQVLILRQVFPFTTVALFLVCWNQSSALRSLPSKYYCGQDPIQVSKTRISLRLAAKAPDIDRLCLRKKLTLKIKRNTWSFVRIHMTEKKRGVVCVEFNCKTKRVRYLIRYMSLIII